MWLSPIFERFVQKSPVTVMVRTLMEVVLAPSKLDDLFEKTAQTGYTREILFSTLVSMMTQVTCSVRQSIGAVYKEMADDLGVSNSAIYGKLNRLEPSVSLALVAYNLFSILKSILANVHGSEFLEQLSYYYLADELSGTYRGMMIALPPEDWVDVEQLSLTQLSSLLQDWATNLNLKAFTTSPRKPKQKKLKPPYDPAHPHVSTARLLEQKKSARALSRQPTSSVEH